MIEIGEVQLLSQLIDNLELLSAKLTVAFNDNNSEDFNKYKKEILATQKKISNLVLKYDN